MMVDLVRKWPAVVLILSVVGSPLSLAAAETPALAGSEAVGSKAEGAATPTEALAASEPAALVPAETTPVAPEAALAARASEALHRAVAFWRDRVAVQGSYVWKYSVDLSVHKGEGDASPSQGWVQPPGTPAIGDAFLLAYEATGDRFYLDGALETARALVATQLVSGGWFHWIEFDPTARLAWCYRQPPSGCASTAAAAPGGVDGDADTGRRAFEDNRDRDGTTLDDNITQSALAFLIRVDQALGGADPALHEAIAYGLDKLIAAQYPNGAWPDSLDWKVPNELTASAWRARYPDSWPRSFVSPPDPEFYPLNDHVLRNMVRLLLQADRAYAEPTYRASALRAGEFLLSAQMPAPQPAWAQLYDRRLAPIWGRKFEPPAIASWESGTTIEALLELHLATGDRRYLEAIAPAAAWLERVRLANGEWARFYELQTDRPLYTTQDYQLTYADDDLPTHYGFKGSFGLPEVLEAWRAIVAEGRDAWLAAAAAAVDRSAVLAELAGPVGALIDALDADGRWVDHDMVRSEAFVEHVDALARYIAAVRDRPLTRLSSLP